MRHHGLLGRLANSPATRTELAAIAIKIAAVPIRQLQIA
jgi:hypothetical protein